MLARNISAISGTYIILLKQISQLREFLKQIYYKSKFENCANDFEKPGKYSK